MYSNKYYNNKYDVKVRPSANGYKVTWLSIVASDLLELGGVYERNRFYSNQHGKFLYGFRVRVIKG